MLDSNMNLKIETGPIYGKRYHCKDLINMDEGKP
jgi:hypothetical protein